MLPCSPRMTKCKASCRHRRLVEDYKDARRAEESVREVETLGYDTEDSLYGPLITFKQWLEGMREEDPDAAREQISA